MSAYIAIFKDCFHEALSSRVLWILLVLITLFLALFVPLSITERPSIRIRPVEVYAPIEFMSQISEAGRDSSSSPGGAIWALLDADDRNRVNKLLAEQEENRDLREIYGNLSRVLNAVNKMEDPRELRGGGAFDGVVPPEDAESLIERETDGLALEEERQLNRLLIGAAFPDAIYLRDEPETLVTYFGKSSGLDPLPLSKNLIVERGMTTVTAFLVGTLGVMMAILVTASMIPQTFDKGAIDLLLSKPINRSFLFLSKYFGGCAFILINACYLVVGIFLLAGIRFEFWQPRILFSIPILLFLFAVYYSISAIAGVIWHNPVVSIVLTIMFWATCAFVGLARRVVDEVVLTPNRIAGVVPAGSALFVANEANRLLKWDEGEATWSQLEDTSGVAPAITAILGLAGPVYDADQDRIVAVRSRPEMNMRGRRGRGSASGSSATAIVGGAESEWQLEVGPSIGDSTVGIHADASGGITVVGFRGMHRLMTDPDGLEYFENIGPDVRLAPPTSVSLNPASRRIAVWDGSLLALYGVDESGRYEVIRQREVESLGAGLVSFRGDVIAIMPETGGLMRFSAADLSETITLEASTDSPPRFIRQSADGAWTAVVHHNGTLRVAGPTGESWSRPRIAEQGNVSAAAFTEDGRLWVAGKYRRVSAYIPESFETVERFWPPLKTIESVERYLLRPLYTVFPKPGELDSVISYLMNEESSTASGSDDLGARRKAVRIWGPIWSNLAFLSVVLGLACAYIRRKDF